MGREPFGFGIGYAGVATTSSIAPLGRRWLAEALTMLDPILLHHLSAARPAGEFISQLVRLDPELAIPAALPLIAARLLGAVSADDEEDDQPEMELATV
jgi:hypothetical protein